ncbi:hypothetical protein PCANC_09269 [Puccinia coronata f. sp. avenae]|uniref:Uncharacterized protein n=1 Tax=Puccinia coronata f. sp. avenae TaxID=200324 RepID=A0A2N5T2Z4_9BASI|nr:hypothetical protein PCANC_09269 [Puccinia coronata f. sp. avenae]
MLVYALSRLSLLSPGPSAGGIRGFPRPRITISSALSAFGLNPTGALHPPFFPTALQSVSPRGVDSYISLLSIDYLEPAAMFQPFESHATQWIKRQEQSSDEYSQHVLADESPSSQYNMERLIRSAANAKPPIVLPSFTQGSFQRPSSDNFPQAESPEASCELDPSLSHSARIPLEKYKLIPLPAEFVLGDETFEQQDPQTVHTKLETISNTFIGIGGHLYRLREVIDYWLPQDDPAILAQARLRWWPSQRVEQARLRTIHEITAIQMGFTEHLNNFNNAICDLREGAFGGRLNTKTVDCAKEMFATLGDLRALILPMEQASADRVKSLSATATWLSLKCLVPFQKELGEPYKAERFDPNHPEQSHLGELFCQHCIGLVATIKFLSAAYQHLAGIFKTINGICKTMIQGIHNLMHEVHEGLTCGEFIATWANRWERVTLLLLLRIVGLPAINQGLQREFPTAEVEYFIPE